MVALTGTKRTALVRRPTESLVAGLVTHIDRVPVDVDLAFEQWAGYVAALNATGWETIEVPSDDACPDAVFIEDAAVVVGHTAMICNPGDDARKPEVGPVRSTLADLGYDIGLIETPGTLDGGDVMRVGTQLYIGQGGRTNAAGIDQARLIFAPVGVRVTGLANTKVLHLKSAVTALPDQRIIGYEPAVTDPTAFPGMISMPEEAGAHVVDLGDGKVLMAASAPASAERVAALGFEPVVVDISEYEKLEGCVTCLSIRLRDLPSNPAGSNF